MIVENIVPTGFSPRRIAHFTEHTIRHLGCTPSGVVDNVDPVQRHPLPAKHFKVRVLFSTPTWVKGALKLLVTIFIIGTSVIGEASFAQGSPLGNTLTTVSEGLQLQDVSCPSSSECVAVGGDSAQYPIVVSETNGEWGKIIHIETTAKGILQSISCASPLNCTAIGNYGTDPHAEGDSHQSFSVFEKNGAWGSARALGPSDSGNLARISCTSSGNCVAVGFKPTSTPEDELLTATLKHGVWSQINDVAVPGGGDFYGVSCPTIRGCVAVGSEGTGSHLRAIYANESGGNWGGISLVSPSVPAGLGDISCFTLKNCVAVGFEVSGNLSQIPGVASEVRGKWGNFTAKKSQLGQGSLLAVNCASPGECAAVGSAGSLYNEVTYATMHLHKWGKFSDAGALRANGYLNGVSCANKHTCVAVGWHFVAKSTRYWGVAVQITIG